LKSLLWLLLETLLLLKSLLLLESLLRWLLESLLLLEALLLLPEALLLLRCSSLLALCQELADLIIGESLTLQLSNDVRLLVLTADQTCHQQAHKGAP